MRPCDEYAALLDDYVDGELTPAEADRVRDHLTVCPGCRAYVDDALAIRAAFPDAEDPEVPEGFAEGVSAAIRAGAAPRRTRRTRWFRTAAPLAACCALVILLSQLPGLRDGEGALARSEDAAAPEIASLEETEDSEAGEEAAVPHTYAAQREDRGAAMTAEDSGDSAEERVPAEDEAAAYDAAPAEALPESDGAGAGEAAPKSGDEPRVNAALVSQEPETWFATLTLTVDQAGPALEALPPDTPVSQDPATGGTVYWLTAEQFTALLEALDHPPYTAEGDGDLARVILLPE